MLSRSVGIFAACAQVARAFLVPAGTSDLEIQELQSGNAFAAQLHAKHQLITLPCPDCVFSAQHDDITETEQGDEPLFHIQGGANSIAVNFTVSDDAKRLEVNGETIYPIGLGVQDIFRSPKTYVHQVPSSASVKDIENGEAKATPLEVTGYGVAVEREEVVSGRSGDILVPLKFSIFQLQGQPVTVDDLAVMLVKAPSGQLSILNIMPIQTEPNLEGLFAHVPESLLEDSVASEDDLPPPPPGMLDFIGGLAHGHHHPEPPRECGFLPAAICKFMHMAGSKVKGIKKGGCHGMKGKAGHQLPGHIKPHFLRPGHDAAAHGPPHGPPRGPPRGHHHGRPHHMRPHGPHHHHHHGHGGRHFMHAFSRGLAAVMIPTMAGVAVGMVVSLIGLLAGRFVGFLWIKFYRGGRRGYASVALDETIAEAEEDKKEEKILEEFKHSEIEVLPVYEEAPTYEEAVNEKK